MRHIRFHAGLWACVMTGALLTSCTSEQDPPEPTPGAAQHESINAAPLYLAALGVHEGVALDEWYGGQGDKDGLGFGFLHARDYASWLQNMDDPWWDEFAEKVGTHPREFEGWVENNDAFFNAVSEASRAERMDDSDVLIGEPNSADLTARVLAEITTALFAASIAHARNGDFEKANARFLDALHVMRHSFQAERTIGGARITILPIYLVVQIATMPNDDLPGMDAYLNNETKRQALDVLKSLDPEDPFEYRRALEFEVEFVVRTRSPGIVARTQYQLWTRDAVRAWTDPNALELLRRLDERTPSSALYPSAPFVGERENDQQKRELLRTAMEALKVNDEN